MLELVVSPAIGRAVSRGAFATNERDVPKGAGLDWARKGARPVGVGPELVRLRNFAPLIILPA